MNLMEINVLLEINESILWFQCDILNEVVLKLLFSGITEERKQKFKKLSFFHLQHPTAFPPSLPLQPLRLLQHPLLLHPEKKFTIQQVRSLYCAFYLYKSCLSYSVGFAHDHNTRFNNQQLTQKTKFVRWPNTDISIITKTFWELE